MGKQKTAPKVKAKKEKPVSLQEARQTVVSEPSKSFAERTKVAQPWLDNNGEQVNK